MGREDAGGLRPCRNQCGEEEKQNQGSAEHPLEGSYIQRRRIDHRINVLCRRERLLCFAYDYHWFAITIMSSYMPCRTVWNLHKRIM